MTMRAIIAGISRQDLINFLLTNMMPRRTVTRWMGRFSRIEQPLVRDVSLLVWRFFADVDLGDARDERFRSMHDCFIRSLRDGARPVDGDPDILVSPCDAIVGACGAVRDGQVMQIKGFSYALADLLGDAAHADDFANGCYATLRLTSGMYHHFHAPYDCDATTVTHVPGDAWNVNPPTLRRIRKLFCRNERAIVSTTLRGDMKYPVTLVPVAAILVAGIRLRFLDLPRGAGRATYAVSASFQKGDEMGWFEHGSTIIVLAPSGFSLCEGVADGMTIRAGRGLMRLPGFTRNSAGGPPR